MKQEQKTERNDKLVLNTASMKRLGKLIKPMLDRPLDNITLARDKNGAQIIYGNRVAKIAVSIPDQPIDFEAIFPAISFLDAISGITNDYFELSVQGSQVLIKGNNGIGFIPKFDGICFPLQVAPLEAKAIDLRPWLPNEIMKTVQQDCIRNYGQVVNFEVGETATKIVGTDGFRLSYQTQGIANETTCQFILPKKSFKALTDILYRPMVAMVDQYNLYINDVELSAIFRLSPIKFPRWEELVRQKGAKLAVDFNRKDFLAIIKQAIKFSGRDWVGELSMESGMLTIETRKDETSPKSLFNYFHKGTFGPTGIDTFKPVDLNLKFLADTLAGKEKLGRIYFNLDDSNAPVEIETGSVKTILLPMRKND